MFFKKTYVLCIINFIFVFYFMGTAWALDNKKIITINNDKWFLSGDKLESITIENSNGIKKDCLIKNVTTKDIKNGGGVINVTSDNKAVIFYSSNRFLFVNEAKKCIGGTVLLHESPDPNADVNIVQDINFNNSLYLSLSLEDKDSWSAIIAKFNTENSLIKESGFLKNNNALGDGFQITGLGQGKISLNGEYVAPNGVGCTADSYPGVWDIKLKKKVIIQSPDSSMDEIDKKCEDLFNGVSSLNNIGGELVSP